jgi:hypothetical protein
MLKVSAMEIKSRLDLTEIFCDVDDFYQSFERYCSCITQLTAVSGKLSAAASQAKKDVALV